MKTDLIRIFTAGDISQTLASAPIPANTIFSCSLQAVVTGSSPTFTLKLQASCDPQSSPTPQTMPPTNWSDIPAATVSISATGTYLIPFQQCSYGWLRVVTVIGSGTGAINANLSAQAY